MARFKIDFCRFDNKVIDSVVVIGKKQIVDGEYEDYYVSKPNKYCIKWICIGEHNGRSNDICVNSKDVPHYHHLRVIKL